MKISRQHSEAIGMSYVVGRTMCASPYGNELLHKCEPIASHDDLVFEYECIEFAKRALQEMPNECARLLHIFMLIKDVRRSIASCDTSVLDEVSLFELRRFLLQLSEIVPLYTSIYECCGGKISISDCKGAMLAVNPEGSDNPSFYISDAYSANLHAIRTEKRRLEQLMRTANAEAVEELVKKRTEVTAMEEKEEYNIRCELTNKLLVHKDELLQATEAIGRVDFAFSKAELARKYNAVRPKITNERCIELVGMSNPEIADELSKNGHDFTRTELTLLPGTCLVTGANMGGKSVVQKTVALNVYLAMCGYFVFCEKCTLPMIDKVVMLCEDYENKISGLSSFGGEIARLTDTLPMLSEGTLFLADEFARGTNPEEGRKLVCILARYLNTKKCFSLLTTHFDGVAKYAKKHYRVAGISHTMLDGLRGDTDIASTLAAYMDYSLIDITDCADSEIPRDALAISRIISKGTELYDYLCEDKDE